MEKKSVHSQYEEKLVETLKNAILNSNEKWEKGWNTFDLSPKNGNTDREYTGINELKLLFSPYTDNRWFTFKQIQALGGKVKKGEKGTLVQFYTNKVEKVLKDEKGNPILDEKGNKQKEIKKLDNYIAKYYIVFNAEQTTGLPAFSPPTITDEDRKKRDIYNIERIEFLVKKLNITVEEKLSNSAFYNFQNDLIVMPDKAQFKSRQEYYGTLLHEVSHATSHPTRLNRPITGDLSSKAYAKEELVAEISSMLLSRKYKIAVQNTKREISDDKNSIAYLKSWIEAGRLTDDDLKEAVKGAIKISNYISLKDKELEQSPAKENIQAFSEVQNMKSSSQAITYNQLKKNLISSKSLSRDKNITIEPEK
ncbi:DUF1738 domain-containing protein [Muribacter muris]|uniref:DUF1738 domain-containing protein n=1 Tax=Muribacter muris TaxID=67855 RepID=A0A4Y9JUH7_9PAST|nr:zincin-like metallopeptidase domain-containing protein [Muribacter muris]MBF0786013.1 DUF1738 domain-containing protein [Muribacter muris]MBF0826783.1 DUF1738 domain-containing protein [Muribacter muris]TFV08145.1 DUF1738 domain-containing protein [Muribacter muris]